MPGEIDPEADTIAAIAEVSESYTDPERFAKYAAQRDGVPYVPGEPFPIPGERMLFSTAEILDLLTRHAIERKPITICGRRYVDVDALDLADPATANSVADAIVRFRGGGYVPLHERYPWLEHSVEVEPHVRVILGDDGTAERAVDCYCSRGADHDEESTDV